MARNTIDLNKINARLGDMNKPQPQRDAYEEYDNFVSHADRQAETEDSDESQPLSSVTFYSFVVALFIIVGGGTFYSSTILGFFPKTFKSQQEALYVSSVDERCSKGWRENVPNVDQLHCAMTDTLSRLCNPRDKGSFIALLNRYDTDYGYWEANLRLAAFSTAVKGQTEGMQLGIEAAKANNEHLSEEQRQKHENNAQAIADDMMADSNAVLRQFKSKFDLSQPYKDFDGLVARGYISVDDLGGFTPEFLKNYWHKGTTAASQCSKAP